MPAQLKEARNPKFAGALWHEGVKKDREDQIREGIENPVKVDDSQVRSAVLWAALRRVRKPAASAVAGIKAP